jgi:hypothetical protein
MKLSGRNRAPSVGLVPAGGPTDSYRKHLRPSALRPVHPGGSSEWSVEHNVIL